MRVDGRTERARGRRLVSGQSVEVDLPPRSPVGIRADPLVEVPVVHADPQIVVVDKPAGLVVHPGAGYDRGTLVQGMLARFPDLAGVGDPQRPGIVHRLDRMTSGLLVVARSPAAHSDLVAQLATHSVERRYLALVRGSPSDDGGFIDAPVGRSHRNPTRMTVATTGRPARTRYRVERRFGSPIAATLLECELETGRTHQVRVHLAAIGMPVLGDADYGGLVQAVPLARSFLHAHALSFRHPGTGAIVSYRSPLPPELAAVLARFGAGGS